jgi:hypothetical protein
MDAFRFQKIHTDDSIAFVHQFLLSHDFDQIMRLRICHDLDFDVEEGETKENLSSEIARYFGGAHEDYSIHIADRIVRELPRRTKKYVAFLQGTVRKRPVLENPRALIRSRGEQKWHGPIDDVQDKNVKWYIKPLLFRFEEVDREINETVEGDTERETEVRKEYTVRWLCFARISWNYISLHWSNFTAGNGSLYLPPKRVISGRFPYWDYVPRLFDEVISFTEANVNEVRLDSLILNEVWDVYREDERYKWTDLRVRAEHKGVALTANSGAKTNPSRKRTIGPPDEEFDNDDEDEDSDDNDLIGIKNLAQVIRRAVGYMLTTKYGYKLPDPKRFDEEILRTLIKEYNPKSYSFHIYDKEEKRMASGAHIYFGKRPGSGTPDCFTHISLHNIREISAMEQIMFLMKHFDANKHAYERPKDIKPEQPSLF